MAYSYGKLLNADLKRIQAIAYGHASSVVKPVDGLSNEDFTGEWQEAFDAKMRELGYEYTGDHCMCERPEHGHESACGWSAV